MIPQGTAAARGAPEAAPADGQRIQALERKIYQAARYIEGLHRELQMLKRAAGVATTPPTRPGQAPAGPAPAPSGTAPPPGTQQAFRGRTPEPSSPAEAERKKAAEKLEAEEAASREQERPDLQAGFLRQANAVLIPKGRLEIDPSLTFRHTNRNQLQVRGLDLIENIFIGNMEVARLKRSVLTHAYSFRYGLTDRIQLNLTLPYQRSYRQAVLSPEVQREIGEDVENETSDGGLGDIQGGVSIHLLQEGEWFPDVILTTSLKSDTGTSPFDVDAGTLATGTGFWGLQTGFTIVKISDPAVLYGMAATSTIIARTTLRASRKWIRPTPSIGAAACRMRSTPSSLSRPGSTADSRRRRK
jgi:hypothetical protein